MLLCAVPGLYFTVAALYGCLHGADYASATPQLVRFRRIAERQDFVRDLGGQLSVTSISVRSQMSISSVRSL